MQPGAAIVIFGVVIVVVTSTHIKYNVRSALPQEDQENAMITCTEHNNNEIWYQGCQTCGCSEEQVMLCTKRDCMSPMQKRRRRSTVTEFASPAGVNSLTIRVPYSHCHGHLQDATYHTGCNICHCGVGGVEYCQMKDCPRHRRNIKEVYDENYARVSEVGCNIDSLGKHISDGCHLCKCTNYGLMCTRNWCPSIEIDFKK